MPISRIISLLILFLPFFSNGQTINTIAGTGIAGFSGDGAAAVSAKISGPISTALDASGNLYIADRSNFRIRKVSTAGVITTIAGTGTSGFSGDGGPATAANISLISDISIDGSGNIYIGDLNNYRVRKISTSGIITTVAGNGATGYVIDGVAASSTSVEPLGLTVDAAGNLYIGCNASPRIRKVNTSGIISTIAGTGTGGFSGDGGLATAAQVYYVEGLVVDGSGNLFFTDYYAGRIRKINTLGIITTVAGNGSSGYSGDGGQATAAAIGYPVGLTMDGTGNLIFADNFNSLVRSVNPSGIISTMAGTGTTGFTGDGGPATSATLNSPYGVAHDAANNIYISDWWNNRIRKITLNNRPVLFTGGHLQSMAVCQSSVGNSINSLLSVIDSDIAQPLSWSILTAPLHGTATVTYATGSTGFIVTPTGLTYSPTGTYSGNDSFRVRVTDGISADTTKIYVSINLPPPAITGGTTTYVGSYTTLFEAAPGGTWTTSNPAIATAVTTTGVIAGIATGTVTVTYTATTGCKVTTPVTVNLSGGWMINTIAGTALGGFTGDGGAATVAEMYNPWGVALDGSGNIYITDQYNNRIRKINSSGIITTIAGTGTTGFSGDGGPATLANIYIPKGIAVDMAGNIYFADYGNHRIRKINTSGTISTIAGNGSSGYTGDGGPATLAQLALVNSVALDGAGNLYLCDQTFNVVRVINTSGIINTIAGSGSGGFSGDGGPATSASLNHPAGVASDGNGNIFITDYLNHRVRKVNTAGMISTIAGNGTPGNTGDGGTATAAELNSPSGIVFDGMGNLYISDGVNNNIRKINTSGIISTVAGTGAYGFGGDYCAGILAQLDAPNGLAADAYGSLYIADVLNNRIRKVSNTNHFPVFTVGHSQAMTVCAFPSADSINTKLIVSDADSAQGETWTVVFGPLHGTVVAAYSANSTGSIVTPHGLFYTPAAGYSGTDSFKVKVTDCVGASDSTVIHVTIVTVATGIGGPTSVCVGSSITLFDTTGGGTYTSSNPAIASVTSGTGVVTGIAAGTVTITYTITLTCGTVTSYKNITVNPLPSVITGPASVCVGSVIGLTDSVGGGIWSSSNSLIASVGTGTGFAGGISSGFATITYTLSTGCYATKPLVVNPVPPVISGTLTVCAGSATLLSDATPGGIWSSGSTGVATVGSGSGLVTGLSAGISSISYSLGTGCRAIAVVTVIPVPGSVAGPTAFCIGIPSILSDPTPGGTWYSSNTLVATIDTSLGIVNPISSGSTIISYVLPSGCQSALLVNVNTMPSPISGTLATCVGSSFTLMDAVSGGIWTTANPSVALIDSSSGNYSATGVGNTVVTYSLGAGCSITATITVNPIPSIISGLTNICFGASSVLTDVIPGGLWSSSSPSVAAIGSGTGIFSGVSAGTAVISYSVGTGTTCTVTLPVTVNPGPAAISGTNHVCQGATTLLTDVGGGTWTSSSPGIASIGSTSGLVTGILPGTTTITYSFPSTGCSVTMVVTVNANPMPISGAAIYCVGTTATLTDGTPGGVWTKNNTNVSVGALTGLVTGITNGTSVISYTLSSGCYAVYPVTVNSSPGAITGLNQICIGATSHLTDPATGGIWSCTPGYIATVGSATGIVTGVSNGIATVSYSIGAGCTAIYTVTINPLPSPITGLTNVCAGSSITLTDAGGGTWSSGSVTVMVGSGTGIVSGVSAGTATITYSLATGCQRTMPVTINPLPMAIVGPSAVCIAATIALSDGSTGGTWSSSNTSVATIGSSSGTVTGIVNGTTTINYTLPTGCAVSVNVTVSASPSSISGLSTVCAGSLITLSDLVAGGLWSSSMSTIASVGSFTGIVTGNSSGIVTISYSLGSGCIVTKVITVNPVPMAISGTGSICSGTTTLLSDGTGGGIWSSGTPSVATISGTGILTASAPGVDTIYYTVTTTGCSTKRVITVNVTPTAIGGPSSVCAGSMIAETDGVGGGTWSTAASAFSVGSASGTLTGISSGTGILSYSIGSCLATRTITVNPVGIISGSLGLCTGSTTTLSNSISGGSWSSSAPAIATVGLSSGIVTGIAPGTAVISCILPTGCISSVTVTVNTAPMPVSGTLHVCAGSSVVLIDGAPGGTWSISGGGYATIGPSSGMVTGILPGMPTVTYSLGSGCTITTTITINSLPAAVTGPSSVCAGSGIAMSDVTPGGLWSTSGGGVASVVSSTGVVSGIAAGTATIIYAITGTGCISSKTVTVNPLPGAITGTGYVCALSSVTLSNSLSGGTWSSSNLGLATVGSSSGVVTGVVAGSLVITYSSGAGCLVTTGFTVNPIPGPIAGVSNMCIGSSVTMTDPVAGGVWVSSNTGIATVGSGTGIVSGVSAGNVVITYLSAIGCSVVKPLTVNPLPLPIGGTAQVCPGTTSTLTDIGGGLWTSASPAIATVGSLSGMVTGVAPGTSLITYSLGPGCNVTRFVTVNPLPATITGTTTHVCTGGTLTLSDITPGGVWSSGTPSIATINTTGIVTSVPGVTGGVVTLSYTLPTGCFRTFPISVISVPPISLIHNLCAWGDTMTVADSNTTGVYTTSYATVTNLGSGLGRIAGNAPGAASVTYTIPSGCFTTTAFTVNPLPNTIYGAGQICSGRTITLTDVTPGGVWSSGMSSVATIGSTTGIVTGISGGTAYITYTLPATGCKVDTPVNVVTSPSVITGPASVFIGSPVTLANVVPGGYWSSSNTSIATVGLTSGYLSGVSVGAATISYTTGGSCRITKNITVMPMKAGSHSSLLGIDGNRVAGTSTENIGILPNPNKGRFVLSVQWDYEEVITISILNIAGEKVKELPVSAKKDAEIKLDIDLDVPPGVYILSASGKFSSLNSRFIISR